jgi:hypothetical protein
MSSRALLSLAFALVACKPAASNSPRDLATETFTDEGKTAQIDVEYRVRPGPELEVLVRLQAIGVEEMDKLVVDVVTNGFVLVEGGTQWTGFVPPRDPQKHSVVFSLLDDTSVGEIRVSVTRSRDSKLLYSDTFGFELRGSTLVSSAE